MWRPRSPWRYLLVTSAVLCPLQRGNVYADPRTPGRRKGVETLSQGSEESTPRGACISWVLVVRWRSLHRDCRDVRGPAATSPARSVARQTTALRRHRLYGCDRIPSDEALLELLGQKVDKSPHTRWRSRPRRPHGMR